MRVLVVEDDRGVSLTIRSALEGVGWRVTAEAPTLAAGRRAARAEVPDVVVADIKLPDGDGLDFVHELWTEVQTPSVIVTGYDSPALEHRAAACGGFAYLIKPVAAEALAASVRLAWARAQDQLALRGRVAALQDRIESRKVIERAKGFLMEREGLTEEAAYLRLQRTSRDTNTPMEAVARAVINSMRPAAGGTRGEENRTDRVRGRRRPPAADGEERIHRSPDGR